MKTRFIHKTNTQTHRIHISRHTISIPATSFGDYTAIIREYKTLSCLKHTRGNDQRDAVEITSC